MSGNESRYSKSHHDKWDWMREKGVKGSLARLVYEWLCCNPSVNIAGLYTFSRKSMIRDLDLSEAEIAQLDNALNHLEQLGLIKLDSETDEVWVVDYIHNGCGLGPSSRQKGWLHSQLRQSQKSQFFQGLVKEYSDYPWFVNIVEKLSDKPSEQKAREKPSRLKQREPSDGAAPIGEAIDNLGLSGLGERIHQSEAADPPQPQVPSTENPTPTTSPPTIADEQPGAEGAKIMRKSATPPIADSSSIVVKSAESPADAFLRSAKEAQKRSKKRAE